MVNRKGVQVSGFSVQDLVFSVSGCHGVIQYFPVRLFGLDPIRACSVVNKVEKLDRKQNNSFRLAPFAAGGGERGKADCYATESGSRC